MATDVFGVSGRLMLRALIEGKATPQEMAELAKRRLRNKIPELELALEGRVDEHHRFVLKLQLERLESVEKDLETLEQRIQEKLKPYALLDDRKIANLAIKRISMCPNVIQRQEQSGQVWRLR